MWFIKMNEISEVIQGLDKNIKFLETTEKGITEIDIKGLLIDILGTIRDMWEKFDNVFKMMDKVKEIEKAAEKGEKYREENSNEDVRRLYQ